MLAEPELKKWLAFVGGFVRAYEAGLDTAPPPSVPAPGAVGAECLPGARPEVLICAPHPDDEMLTGSLALRLRRQGVSVLVLALTLGSDPARKAGRRDELVAACRVAGFCWRLVTEPLAFQDLRPEQERRPEEWQPMLEELERHFAREMPGLVLAPHGLDHHPAHRAAHRLVIQALERHSRQHRCRVLLAETEYWQPLADANLLLGVNPEELALLLGALACHRGEMARHPYHLRQPARMMDSVRRGGEVLGHPGGCPPEFLFGELYRLSRMDHGRLTALSRSKVLPPGDEVGLPELSALFENES